MYLDALAEHSQRMLHEERVPIASRLGGAQELSTMEKVIPYAPNREKHLLRAREISVGRNKTPINAVFHQDLLSWRTLEQISNCLAQGIVARGVEVGIYCSSERVPVC